MFKEENQRKQIDSRLCYPAELLRDFEAEQQKTREKWKKTERKEK